MKEKYFKFLNSPFLLALCCALFTFFGKCFLDFACISAVSSIFLSILTTLEYREKINIRFMVKYSLFFFLLFILRVIVLICFKYDPINPFVYVTLAFKLPAILSLCVLGIPFSFVFFFIASKLTILFLNKTSFKNNIKTNIILLVLLILLIVGYSLKNININFLFDKSINLSNFKEKVFDKLVPKVNTWSYRDLPFGEQIEYKKKMYLSYYIYLYLINKYPNQITKDTVISCDMLFDNMETINRKKYYNLFIKQKNILNRIKNPNLNTYLALSEIYKLTHYYNCSSIEVDLSKECLEHQREELEINKNVCKLGGSCMLGDRVSVSNYIVFSSVNNKNVVIIKEVEKKYDDIISFLESLDTNDKRVALGLKTYLIGKYYTIFNLNMSDKKVKEYYKNNKEQIDKNIEKALELNEKFKLNEDGIRDGRLVSKSDDYYDIAYIYKHAGDKEKYEHFNKLYNTYKKVYKPAKSPAYVPPKHLLNSVNKS